MLDVVVLHRMFSVYSICWLMHVHQYDVQRMSTGACSICTCLGHVQCMFGACLVHVQCMSTGACSVRTCSGHVQCMSSTC